MPKPAEHNDLAAADLAVDRMAVRRVGVVVLGMHRSGSSAITRMLSLLGCALPATLMPANPTNPRGHWESDAVAQFNDEILTLAGTRWDDWLPVNPRLSETLVWPQLIARGRDVLRQEFADAPLFVLKDPRICKLGNFWLEVLAAEGVNAAFVLPLRNPLEVARSLSVRNGIEEHQGLLIWLRHVLAAEAASRGRPRVFTDFAVLLDRWEELSVRLSAGLGLVWPRVSVLSESEISQFLTPELRHHVSNTAELGNNSAISPWVRKAYEVLLGWARDGEKSADHAVLDQISREFDNAGTAFARPMLNAGLAIQRAAQADAERIALVEERDAIAGRLGEAEAGFHHACAEREARTAERDELAGERAALAEERDAIVRRLGEVETGFHHACAEREARTAERDELAGDRAALAEERDAVVRRLAEVETELTQACADRDARTAERDELAGERAALAEERNKVAWRLGEVEADFARVSGERDARTAERDQLAGEYAALAEERDMVAWRLGEVEAQLADAKADNDRARERSGGLEDELATAHAGADALKHRLAVTESTLCQREEEIAQLGAELEATRLAITQHADAAGGARDEAYRLAQECQGLRDAMSVANADHSARSRQVQRELAEVQAAWRIAEDRASRVEAENESRGLELVERIAQVAELAARLRDNDGDAIALKAELNRTQTRLDERFAEIAQLTRLFREQEKQTGKQLEHMGWLRQLYAVAETTPHWWGIMPQYWRRQRELRRLQRKGLFNAEAYLAQNPDVSAAGMDPLRHYVLHGIAEGRVGARSSEHSRFDRQTDEERA